MKKILLFIMLSICMVNVYANDTISVDNAKIERVIEHKTTNSKGKPVTKYFMIYRGELVSTSKTVVDKYNLCRKYNARVALVMVRTKSNKRIILN